MLIVPVIILFLALGLAIRFMQSESDQSDIQRWAQERGYQIDEIEKTWFDKGPYWFKGKRRIYRCRVRDAQGNSRLVYMRTRLLQENDYAFFDP